MRKQKTQQKLGITDIKITISEFEGLTIETIQNRETEKKLNKNEKRKLQDNFKWLNIRVIGIPKEEEVKREAKNI